MAYHHHINLMGHAMIFTLRLTQARDDEFSAIVRRYQADSLPEAIALAERDHPGRTAVAFSMRFTDDELDRYDFPHTKIAGARQS